MISNVVVVALGGSGFVGGHLKKLCDFYGVELHSFSIRSPVILQSMSKLILKSAEKGKRIVLIDLAQNPSVSNYVESDRSYDEAGQTRHRIFEDFHDYIDRYIYVSTDRVFRLGENGKFYVPESGDSLDIYAARKLDQENLVRKFSNEFGVRAVVVRFPNLYGSDQKSEQLIPSIIRKIRAGERKIEIASLDGGRNYLHVSDAVSGLMSLLLQRHPPETVCFSGEFVEIKTLINLIVKSYFEYTNERIAFKVFNSSLDEVRHRPLPSSLDDSYARNKLNWRPKLTIENSILDIIKE